MHMHSYSHKNDLHLTPHHCALTPHVHALAPRTLHRHHNSMSGATCVPTRSAENETRRMSP